MRTEELLTLDYLLPDTLRHIGSFLSGKAVSTLALAISTTHDENDRTELRRAVLRHVVQGAQRRCTLFLTDAPTALQYYWRLLSNDVLVGPEQHNRPHSLSLSPSPSSSLRRLSEWCAVLDYCEQSPQIMAKFYQKDDFHYHHQNPKALSPRKKCWPLGSADFRGSDVVLSSHVWDPELLDLCERWFDPKVDWGQFFPDGDLEEIKPESTVGLLSWRRDDVFETVFESIMVGALVCHTRSFPDLIWLPTATRRTYPIIDRKLSETGLDWLTKIASSDHHMLCTWNTSHNRPSMADFVRRDDFVDKIVKLMRRMDDGLW